MKSNEQNNIILDKIIDNRKRIERIIKQINRVVKMTNSFLEIKEPFNEDDLRSIYQILPEIKEFCDHLTLFIREVDKTGIATDQISTLDAAIQDLETRYQILRFTYPLFED